MSTDADFEIAGPYDDPRIYEILHARGAGKDARGFLRVAERFAGIRRARRGLWLEPACGTGRFMRELARLGIRSIGVDLDEGMLRHGRVLSRKANLERRVRMLAGDMRRLGRVDGLTPDTFAVALCPDNSIRHLASDAALVEHLRGVRSLLKPGGVYIVGLGLQSETGEFPSEQVWMERRGATQVRQVIEFVPPEPGARGRVARIEMAYAHVTVHEDSSERSFLMRYALRTYTLRQWRAAVRRAGMREVGVVDMRARDLEPDRTMYALRILAHSDARVRS